MSSTLFGRERSGTPTETRGLTRDLASRFQSELGGLTFDPQEAQADFLRILGFDPGDVGLPGAIRSGLIDPADETAGLFATMRPFEQRMMAEGSADLLSNFGAGGARFSRSAQDAQTRMASEFGAEFGRNREQALLGANAQRNQLIASLIPQLIGAQQLSMQNQYAPWDIMSRFASPGPMAWQPGIAGDLLGAAALAAGSMG